MKVLITGICGFVGSALATALRERVEGIQLCGIDNLMRPGSETNRAKLRAAGVEFIHGDIRADSDLASLPKADWVIDAAANPSVLAGVAGGGSSRQLFEHNLASLGNVLEYCRRHSAGLLMLSSSRVYSIAALAGLPMRVADDGFELDTGSQLPAGVGEHGIDVDFSTQAPISLYGATKLAAEVMALEYGAAFQFPVWVTRCGVLAGAGQFGTPDQGIFAYWVNAHLRRRPLQFIGFGGKGHQVRDAFHPRDLAGLLLAQMETARADGPRIYTAGGGPGNAMSLAQLNAWCDSRFGAHSPQPSTRLRPYDIPWVAMDNRRAATDFAWRPGTGVDNILEEIAMHAERHPEWLETSGV
jgi:CDP-paratose 2-epimerase